MLFIFAAIKSAEELAKVKASLEENSAIPYEILLGLLLALAVVILVSVLISYARYRRHLVIFRGWTSISDPNRIAAVLKRAATRQASSTLEVFGHQHSSIYRGQVFDTRPGSHVTLELSLMPNPDVDFEGLPVQIHLNFRPAPKEDMEHYQFSSHTLPISFEKEKTWRVARLEVAWPKSIISAQRRDFLRLEPVAEHAMKAVFHPAPEAPPEDPGDLPVITEGAVIDLSVGGAQLIFNGTPGIAEDQSYLITIDLPMTGLDLALKSTRLHFFFNIRARDVIWLSPDSSEPDTRTIVRGNFTGRYRILPDTGAWSYVSFSPETFQDVSHWIHAYQRHLLKKGNGLMPIPPERPNIFPSIPPSRG